MAKRRESGFSYIIFNKPYSVLSQFTREHGHKSLADYGPFPPGMYPVGRLDADSEGLILLTDHNVLKHRITDPKFEHPKTYIAQIERVPDDAALRKLSEGVHIEGRKTKEAQVHLIQQPPHIPERGAPIRFRKTVPTSWISITLREGRNRQVRKMTAAVGHPTLRLIRVAIGPISLGDLPVGTHRELSEDELRVLGNTLSLELR